MLVHISFRTADYYCCYSTYCAMFLVGCKGGGRDAKHYQNFEFQNLNSFDPTPNSTFSGKKKFSPKNFQVPPVRHRKFDELYGTSLFSHWTTNEWYTVPTPSITPACSPRDDSLYVVAADSCCSDDIINFCDYCDNLWIKSSWVLIVTVIIKLLSQINSHYSLLTRSVILHLQRAH